jgi:hypothetical protein
LCFFDDHINNCLHYGRQYQEIFARSHVELELRETAGAVENLKLLQDPNSDVQIAFVTGGLSDAKHAPGVLSLGNRLRSTILDFLSRERAI